MIAKVLIGIEFLCLAIIGFVLIAVLSGSDAQYVILMMLTMGGWIVPALLLICMIIALFLIISSDRDREGKRRLLMFAIAPAVIAIGLLAGVLSSEIMFFFEPMKHG